MNLYPLKFEPIFKERLWGGAKLKDVLEKPVQGDTIGESWEISAVEGAISEVANGKLKGISLLELIETYQGKLMGNRVYKKFGNDFPILIKFIDAKLDLSIQLHPNDELAMKRHNSFGKTEMWYIMHADEGAELIVGFNKDVTKQEYVMHLENNSLPELLNYEKVKEGDVFFINTGKIHAIGAGVLLAEIQQTSDITYRVYDWERKDKDGNTRELHTALALDAIDYEKKEDFKMPYEKQQNTSNAVVKCPYFITNYLDIEGHYTTDITDRGSFTIYMCVRGEAILKNEYGSEKIKKGETILIPANTERLHIDSLSGVKLLEVYI
ncbi:type I phosphomannose isomerase catalytic subunit [Leptobacterium sp. I13]|uniref:type I phosphomannose isomerase catalytic subunit n=1 Tax=Leptobacterium meishanense TaxID=3128904 RepID=UPI0030ED469E